MSEPIQHEAARTTPMPFRMLLDEAMRRTRRHIRRIYPAVAVPVALAAVVTNIVQVFWFQRIVAETGMEQLSFWSPESILMTLVNLFVVIVGTTAMQKAAVDVTAGRPVVMGEAWRFAVRPVVLVTLLLQFLAVAASAILCLVPVLYVAPLLSFTAPIMVDEGVFGGRALSRSAELTRYNPERRFFEMPLVKVLILQIVGVVISYAVIAVVTLPFQIPMLIGMVRQAMAGREPDPSQMVSWMWLQVPSQFLQSLVTLAVSLYVSFGLALLFFDTRNRKEGTDLAAEIHAVFGPGAPAGEPAP